MFKKAVSFVIILIIVLAFIGCASSHGIPDGAYVGSMRFKVGEQSEFALRTEENYSSSYWQIKRNKATYFTSGYSYKCKITQENGKILFNGEKYRDISCEIVGYVFKCEAEYDEESKTLILLVIEVAD